MYNQMFTITIITLLGLLIGGGVGLLMLRMFKKKLNALYLFAGGVLIGVIVFKLIPKTIQDFNVIGLSVGFLGGIIFLHLIDEKVHNLNISNKTKLSQPLVASFFLVIAIAIHNLPAGITLGMNLGNINPSSHVFITTFVLHQIPEGMALFISLASWQQPVLSFFGVSLVLSLILFGSIYFGEVYLNLSLKLKTILMGSALGTLSYATFYSIIWRSRNTMSIGKFILNITIGVATTFLYAKFFLVH